MLWLLSPWRLAMCSDRFVDEFYSMAAWLRSLFSKCRGSASSLATQHLGAVFSAIVMSWSMHKEWNFCDYISDHSGLWTANSMLSNVTTLMGPCRFLGVSTLLQTFVTGIHCKNNFFLSIHFRGSQNSFIRCSLLIDSTVKIM